MLFRLWKSRRTRKLSGSCRTGKTLALPPPHNFWMNPEPRNNLEIYNTETFSLLCGARICYSSPALRGTKRLALKSLTIKDLLKSLALRANFAYHFVVRSESARLIQ